ncbi:MAG: ADP-ribosylation factor-like protein [Candidatus Thorarchaeota archaeon]
MKESKVFLIVIPGGMDIPYEEAEKWPALIILGTPNSGKTSLLYRLYSGIFYKNAPMAPSRPIEQVRVDNTLLRAINIIENELSYEEWSPMTHGATAIIFLVDVSADQSIAEGMDLYKGVMARLTVDGIYQGIFGNKTDLRNYSSDALRQRFHENDHLNSAVNSPFFCVSLLTANNLRKSLARFMYNANLTFHVPVFRK